MGRRVSIWLGRTVRLRRVCLVAPGRWLRRRSSVWGLWRGRAVGLGRRLAVRLLRRGVTVGLLRRRLAVWLRRRLMVLARRGRGAVLGMGRRLLVVAPLRRRWFWRWLAGARRVSEVGAVEEYSRPYGG